MSTRWSRPEWEAWASGEPDSSAAPAAAAAAAPIPSSPKGSADAPQAPAKQKDARPRRGFLRLAAACIVFGLLAALAAILPPSLPGELPATELAGHDGPPCASCPPSERLAGVGGLEDGTLLRVTVAFDGVPTELWLELEGTTRVLLRRKMDATWTASEPVSSASATKRKGWRVSERGSVVVFGLPEAGSIRGIAVATRGDRIPESGFVALRPRPRRQPNAFDTIVVVLLLLAGVVGWRLGLAAAVGDVLALAFVLLLTALLWRPLATLLENTPRSGSASGALAVGLLVAAIGLAGALLTIPFAPVLEGLAGRSKKSFARALAAALEALRALVVLATLLAVADGLAMFGPLAPALRDSALAGCLLDAARRLMS